MTRKRSVPSVDCPCCGSTNVKHDEIRFYKVVDGKPNTPFSLNGPPDDIEYTCECGCVWLKSKRRSRK